MATMAASSREMNTHDVIKRQLSYKNFVIVVKCRNCGRISIHKAYYRKKFTHELRRIQFYRCPWCGYHGRVSREWDDLREDTARNIYSRINASHGHTSFVSALSLVQGQEKQFEEFHSFINNPEHLTEGRIERHEGAPVPQFAKGTVSDTGVHRHITPTINELAEKYSVSITNGTKARSPVIVSTKGKKAKRKRDPFIKIEQGKPVKKKAMEIKGFERVERTIIEVRRKIATGMVLHTRVDITGMKFVGHEKPPRAIKVIDRGNGGDAVITVDSYLVKHMVAEFGVLINSAVARFVKQGGRPDRETMDRLGPGYGRLPKNMRSSRVMQKMMGDILAYNGERKRVTIKFANNLKYMSRKTASKFIMTLAILSKKFDIVLYPGPFTARIISSVLLMIRARSVEKNPHAPLSPLYALYKYLFRESMKKTEIPRSCANIIMSKAMKIVKTGKTSQDS